MQPRYPPNLFEQIPPFLHDLLSNSFLSKSNGFVGLISGFLIVKDSDFDIVCSAGAQFSELLTNSAHK